MVNPLPNASAVAHLRQRQKPQLAQPQNQHLMLQNQVQRESGVGHRRRHKTQASSFVDYLRSCPVSTLLLSLSSTSCTI